MSGKRPARITGGVKQGSDGKWTATVTAVLHSATRPNEVVEVSHTDEFRSPALMGAMAELSSRLIELD